MKKMKEKSKTFLKNFQVTHSTKLGLFVVVFVPWFFCLLVNILFWWVQRWRAGLSSLLGNISCVWWVRKGFPLFWGIFLAFLVGSAVIVPSLDLSCVRCAKSHIKIYIRHLIGYAYAMEVTEYFWPWLRRLMLFGLWKGNIFSSTLHVIVVTLRTQASLTQASFQLTIKWKLWSFADASSTSINIIN